MKKVFLGFCVIALVGGVVLGCAKSETDRIVKEYADISKEMQTLISPGNLPSEETKKRAAELTNRLAALAKEVEKLPQKEKDIVNKALSESIKKK